LRRFVRTGQRSDGCKSHIFVDKADVLEFGIRKQNRSHLLANKNDFMYNVHIGD